MRANPRRRRCFKSNERTCSKRHAMRVSSGGLVELRGISDRQSRRCTRPKREPKPQSGIVSLSRRLRDFPNCLDKRRNWSADLRCMQCHVDIGCTEAQFQEQLVTYWGTLQRGNGRRGRLTNSSRSPFLSLFSSDGAELQRPFDFFPKPRGWEEGDDIPPPLRGGNGRAGQGLGSGGGWLHLQ